MTVNIFLREMRGVWKKADSLPSDLVVMAAKDRGIIPKSVMDKRKVLELLMDAWENAGMRAMGFPDFEAALVREGIKMRRGKSSYREMIVPRHNIHRSSGGAI